MKAESTVVSAKTGSRVSIDDITGDAGCSPPCARHDWDLNYFKLIDIQKLAK